MLAKEIRIAGNLLRDKDNKIACLHFGGGSPTILATNDFEYLISVIKDEFTISSDTEIAIEVDPRNVNEEKIASYAKAGINRVSIGVQDFSHDVQLAVNREQSFDLVYNCVRLFRKYGINNINLDLIYGLPKQTIEGIKKNIDYSMLLKPDRIALFAYAHVKWMKRQMQLINEEDLPDEAARVIMYKVAAEKLRQENYVAIGLDHFAKNDDPMTLALKSRRLKRNFQGYSTDNANSTIGFGISAISHLQFGYAQNTLDFEQYKNNILTSKFATAKGIYTGDDEILRKKIIDEIMCYTISNL